MTVYVVTKGQYSDYHICEVLLDEYLAYKYATHIGGDVEIFETDRVIDGDRYFDVIVYYDGMTQCTGLEDGIYDVNTITDNDYTIPNKAYQLRSYYEVIVKAKDGQHAEKIAHDLVAKYKAQKEGIT